MAINTIEDVPIFMQSLRILKFLSFLLQHNYRRYVALFGYFLLTAAIVVQLYFTTDPVDEIVRNAYIGVLLSNVVLRASVLCFKRYKFEQFMDKIRFMYIELRNSEDLNIKRMLEKMVNYTVLVTKVNLIMGLFGLAGFLAYPVFASSKALPYAIYAPGIVDIYQSPFYEIFFIVETLFSPVGCCTYIPFTNLLVAFTLFAILMCEILQYKLANLRDVGNEKAREVVVWCVKYQLELIKCVNTINELCTNSNMIEFLTFGAMLCAMLFSMVIAENFSQQLIISIYMFMIFSQSAILYYFGNVLYDQSLKVAIAAYDSDWFEFDISTQKSLQILIVRSQKPLAILVGNVYPMNLELLQSLLNVTYSYFTLLNKVYG